MVMGPTGLGLALIVDCVAATDLLSSDLQVTSPDGMGNVTHGRHEIIMAPPMQVRIGAPSHPRFWRLFVLLGCSGALSLCWCPCRVVFCRLFFVVPMQKCCAAWTCAVLRPASLVGAKSGVVVDLGLALAIGNIWPRRGSSWCCVCAPADHVVHGLCGCGRAGLFLPSCQPTIVWLTATAAVGFTLNVFDDFTVEKTNYAVGGELKLPMARVSFFWQRRKLTVKRRPVA